MAVAMEPLLLLTHRIPFPPDKGDKIRSYHLLRHLAARHAVHLGTFIDDPADRAHLARLNDWCASVAAFDIAPTFARVRSLAGFLRGEALTLQYYRTPALQRWVHHTIATRRIYQCVVFSSAMAQFVDALPVARVVDFCDVDSAKWTQYSAGRRWPSSALYRREGERLLDYERRIASRSHSAVFATHAEARLFVRAAPEVADRVHVIENGVDFDYFRPDPSRPTPFAQGEEAIVFTGAMNYWPNIDAVAWFATEVLPRLARIRPAVRFHVVGMKPADTVAALTRDPRVVVTGRVPDVRPYLQHARLVVAPLRVARGIQNKVLEAMAMARPVLVSTACADGLNGAPGVEFAVAEGADEFAARAAALIADAHTDGMGDRARARIVAERDWGRNLATFDALLDAARSVHSEAATLRERHAR